MRMNKVPVIYQILQLAPILLPVQNYKSFVDIFRSYLSAVGTTAGYLPLGRRNKFSPSGISQCHNAHSTRVKAAGQVPEVM